MTFLRAHRLAWISVAALALVLAGCGDDDVMIGEDDAGGGDAGPGDDGGPPPGDGGVIVCGETTCGTGEYCCNASCSICAPAGGTCTEMACSDAGPPPSDAGPGGEECGPVTCAAGEVCCNESCGICTAPGEGCIAIACADAGPPIDAGPGGESCGGFTGATCPAGQFCHYRIEDICGAADATGVCEVIPVACPPIYLPVCGCDGRTYDNECSAHASGTSAAASGECGGTATCDPQDARGEGMCDAFFGYYWSGSDCYGVSGCSCVGASCGSGWGSPDECRAAHSECPSAAACGGIGGASCASAEYCDYRGDTCGAGDTTGSCLPRPELCTDEISPVCGCDGVTYSNECEANRVGIDVDYYGECGMAMGDCRDTGCPMGQVCQVCWLGYACIPEGAIC